jgi:L-malate glycosyltransferase
MKKLAFITTMVGSPWGGSEFLWTMTAAEAIAQGHQVDCSTYDWALTVPQIQQLGIQGAHLYPRPRSPSRSIYTRLKNKIRRLGLPIAQPVSDFQAIFDRKPDVICISQGASYDIGFDFAENLYDSLQKYSIPYIFVCQFNSDLSPLDDTSRERVLKAFQGASKVLFVAQQNYQLAEHHLASKILNAAIIQNPVNIQDIALVPFPESNTIAFASVARLDVSFKGQDILFKVLSQFQWRERNWKLNLYGTGKDRKYLETLAEYYQIGDRVHFAGHVSDISAVWKENHILLMPSRAEGCPLSLVEASICGRPAVVSNVGDNAQCVSELETGFISDSYTYLSFSDAMEKAWSAKESWQEMGIKAHNTTVSKLDRQPGKSLLKIILDSIKIV